MYKIIQDYNNREYRKSNGVHLYKVHITESFTGTKTNRSNRWHIYDIDGLFDYNYMQYTSGF